MSGYRGHLAGAAIFCVMYVAFVSLVFSLGWLASQADMLNNWQTITLLFVVALLFGLWPDVDTNSKGQDIFLGAAFGLDVLLIINGYIETAAYLGLIAMLPILGKHRGWTHSFWAMALVPLPILIVPYLYNHDNWQSSILFYGAAVVGYFSHLFFDGRVTRLIKRHG